ncbi:hypothetical protein GQR58_027405 [Nymphon striatum]|nr:hypothetical protein GQR58_027405 [Nymphon striatum]
MTAPLPSKLKGYEALALIGNRNSNATEHSLHIDLNMVDITSDISFASTKTDKLQKPMLINCITDREDALDYVERMNDDVFSSGYQCKAFLNAWLNQPEACPYFLILAAENHGQVLLPLEIQPNGIATYCGGTHANGNFPVGRIEDIKALSNLNPSDLINAVKGLPIAASAIFLERQHSSLKGVGNPFVLSDADKSPNVALSLSLDGGFAGVMERHHGKRKRKRQRNHTRKLDVLGSVDIVQQVQCEDVRDVLNAFFDMKAERFKEQGICDVFKDVHVREMFAQMFLNSCTSQSPNHLLKAIYLNGKPISVIGCTVHDGRLTVEFGTFDHQYSAAGPGDLLFYHAIEDACDKGYEIFDFGIGDEFYKRSWCEIETWHRDTLIAITPKGKLQVIHKKARNYFVRMIKTNKTIWSNLKKLRSAFGWMRKC